MALTITAVPDIRYVVGDSGRLQGINLQPGSSDYVTGGYPITASAVELGKLMGFELLAQSGTAPAYALKFVATAPLTQPQTQFFMQVFSGSTQVAASTDLSGASWSALALGW